LIYRPVNAIQILQFFTQKARVEFLQEFTKLQRNPENRKTG